MGSRKNMTTFKPPLLKRKVTIHIVVTMITMTMFENSRPPYSSCLMIAGKLDDSNNLTWVDGYQNKNAYVMTNIYRYRKTLMTLTIKISNSPKTLEPLHG